MDMGIAIHAQSSHNEHRQSKIYDLVNQEVGRITILTVAKAAEMGDELAISLLQDAGARLGRKAAFLVNLLNPEVMIVGGGIEIGGAILIDALRNTVKQSSIPEAAEKLRIVPSQLGEDAVPFGAAALVAQNYFISV